MDKGISNQLSKYKRAQNNINTLIEQSPNNKPVLMIRIENCPDTGFFIRMTFPLIMY